MTFKRILKSVLAGCMVATLVATMCACDDLGEYEDTDEYYDSFGDIVLIDSVSKSEESYSVEDYFYNKESRDDFLENEETGYEGVEPLEYVYMAIPLERDILVDSLALYLRGDGEGVQQLCLSVYLAEDIPSKWQAIGDPDTETVTENGVEVQKEIEYDDPDPSTALANVAVTLNGDGWTSFFIDAFAVGGAQSQTLDVIDGQYLLLQFRNNSGILEYNAGNGSYVDPVTEKPLEKVKVTMTNLLIRALEPASEG